MAIVLGIECCTRSLQATAPLFHLMIYFYSFDILGNQCTKMCGFATLIILCLF